jgi:1-acyl-sn-glycerol-3-phosphate acyltransferase
MRILLGIWTWLSFALVSTVGFVICLTVFVLTWPVDPTRRWTGRGIRLTGRAMCAAVPAWRFSIRGRLPDELPERCVCVCNHRSNLDPFVLTLLPWEMKFLAKSKLFQIPIVGWGIFIAGDIPLVRGSSRSIKRAMRRAAWYVERGMPVLFFPEGTRSRDGGLLPFKDGAFRLAIDTGAHVLPIALSGTEHALRKGDWKPSPARGRITVGAPIPTSGLTLADLPGLKLTTRAALDALVRTLDS